MSLSEVAATWAMDAGRWSRYHSISVVHHHRQSSAQPSPVNQANFNWYLAVSLTPTPNTQAPEIVLFWLIWLTFYFKQNWWYILCILWSIKLYLIIKDVIDIKEYCTYKSRDGYYWNGLLAQCCTNEKGGTCSDSRRIWECEHLMMLGDIVPSKFYVSWFVSDCYFLELIHIHKISK